MPTYLLDTCAWIDALLAPEKLSSSALKIISSPIQLGLCSISLLEVARKEARGNITLMMPLQEWFKKIALPEEKIVLFDMNSEIVTDATRLPTPFINRQGKTHKDPADQIIVATARHYNLTLLTSDQVLLNYPHVKTLKSRD